jgi:hypothetical protein
MQITAMSIAELIDAANILATRIDNSPIRPVRELKQWQAICDKLVQCRVQLDEHVKCPEQW